MITKILAALFGIMLFKITLDVVKKRRSFKVSLGDGENNEITNVASAHNNFTQYVPMLLILFYLNEISGMLSNLVLIPLAIIIFIGRVLHYKALTSEKMNFSLRVKGMKLTLFPLMVMSLALIISEVIKLIR